jgi:hypothetical protein
MNRRKFIKNNSQVALFAPFVPNIFLDGSIYPVEANRSKKPDWLIRVIKQNDINLGNILQRFISDKASSNYGGVMDAFEMATAHSATSLIKTGLNSLVSEESVFYGDQQLLTSLVACCEFLKSVQHDDGTIDLVSTNFHSTPDTAFIVKWLAPGYRLLEDSNVPNKMSLLTPLRQFLDRAGVCLKIGGIHTPNHRWVVCSALAELYKIDSDPRYLQRAEEWLAEKIDMDSDGQYNERSSYIYSSLSNRVLISTARGFDKPELLDYVRKNLEMTFYYLHPNGEIVTEASGRQDNSIVGTLENYYYPYRYLAIKDKNSQFAAACRLIEETAFAKITGFLHYFLEDPGLWQTLPVSSPLPVDYAKVFSHSGLTRIRRGDYDGSILLNTASFFTFHKKKVVLQGVRFASAFFGKGQFSSATMEQKDGKYILSASLEGPYFQPLPVEYLPDDGDWEKMPKTRRPQSEVQKYTAMVRIGEIEGGFELDIDIQGTDHVPLAVELIFREGGSFSGVEGHPEMKDVQYLKERSGTYTVDGESIHFGPGIHQHQWVEIRGALPRVNAPTVFLTGFTPFHHTIRIT